MKLFKLILTSWNTTTTINVDLSESEVKLMKDINKSLVKQNAQIILDIQEVTDAK